MQRQIPVQVEVRRNSREVSDSSQSQSGGFQGVEVDKLEEELAD